MTIGIQSQPSSDVVEGISLDDLEETQRKLELKLQLEMQKREAGALKLHEKLAGLKSEFKGYFDHLSNTLDAIQLQLFNINKEKEHGDDFGFDDPQLHTSPYLPLSRPQKIKIEFKSLLPNQSLSSSSFNSDDATLENEGFVEALNSAPIIATVAKEADSFTKKTIEMEEQKVFDEMLEPGKLEILDTPALAREHKFEEVPEMAIVVSKSVDAIGKVEVPIWPLVVPDHTEVVEKIGAVEKSKVLLKILQSMEVFPDVEKMIGNESIHGILCYRDVHRRALVQWAEELSDLSVSEFIPSWRITVRSQSHPPFLYNCYGVDELIKEELNWVGQDVGQLLVVSGFSRDDVAWNLMVSWSSMNEMHWDENRLVLGMQQKGFKLNSSTVGAILGFDPGGGTLFVSVLEGTVTTVELWDLSSSVIFSKEDVGKKRALVFYTKLQELNNSVIISILIAIDVDGEDDLYCIIVSISNDNMALVAGVDDQRLELQGGDLVLFYEMRGMTRLNGGKPRKIKNVEPYSFNNSKGKATTSLAYLFEKKNYETILIFYLGYLDINELCFLVTTAIGGSTNLKNELGKGQFLESREAIYHEDGGPNLPSYSGQVQWSGNGTFVGKGLNQFLNNKDEFPNYFSAGSQAQIVSSNDANDNNAQDYSVCTYGKVGCSFRGLCNLGDTYFFNSIMQNMLATVSLRGYFFELNESVRLLSAAMRKLSLQRGKEVGSKGVTNPISLFRIVNEPSAASIAYCFEKKNNEAIMVFDPGSGTFDVSNFEVSTRCRNGEEKVRRSVPSDGMVSVRVDHEAKWMNDMEISTYDSWFVPIGSSLPGQILDGFICLVAIPGPCHKLMMMRKREDEGGASFNYLQDMYEKHENWLFPFHFAEFFEFVKTKKEVSVSDVREDATTSNQRLLLHNGLCDAGDLSAPMAMHVEIENTKVGIDHDDAPNCLRLLISPMMFRLCLSLWLEMEAKFRL